MPARSPLPVDWELPEEIRSRFGERAGKQRAMFAEGHLLLVLHAPPHADENSRRARFYWRKADGSWLGSEPEPGSSTLTKHLDEYKQLLEKIDQAVDQATLAREYFDLMSQLSPLLRATRNLLQALQEARELIDAPEMINHRDRAYEIERLAELLYEDAKNGLDFATARRAEEQAFASHRMEISAHRLNMLVAFFFPLATLSAIFGTNLTHGFEGYQAPWLFLAFLGTGILLGMLLTVFVSANLPASEPSSKKRN